MAKELMPASAKPFSPPGKSILVMSGYKMPHWLITKLRDLGRGERSLRTQEQIKEYLEHLIQSDALWTLASMKLPLKEKRSEDSEDKEETDVNLEVEAYIVYIDLVWKNEVVFKLSPNTIDSVVRFHRKNLSIEGTDSLPPIDSEAGQGRALIAFEKAINSLVIHTGVRALASLGRNGGTLSGVQRREAELAVKRLVFPTLTPAVTSLDTRISSGTQGLEQSGPSHASWGKQQLQHAMQVIPDPNPLPQWTQGTQPGHGISNLPYTSWRGLHAMQVIPNQNRRYGRYSSLPQRAQWTQPVCECYDCLAAQPLPFPSAI